MAQTGSKTAKSTGQNKRSDWNIGDHQPQQRKTDEVTVAYIEQVLCGKARRTQVPTSPASQITDDEMHELPPLTSSNTIDIELYAFIAVILNNFVQTWYNRITPDHHFVREIVQIIAHCTRGLEQRLRQIDLEALILDEIPEVLIQHIRSVRLAQQSPFAAKLPPTEQRMRYNTLRPHLALEPVPHNSESSIEQRENETAWCILLVNRVLPLLLPPEDLENPCLDVLVSEIFAHMILKAGILGKASEGWLLWDAFSKVLRSVQSQSTGLSSRQSAPSSRLQEHGLLDPEGASRRVSAPAGERGRFEAVSQTIWFVAQCTLTAWAILRFFVLALARASSIPARTSRTRCRRASMSSDAAINDQSKTATRPPIVSMRIWICVSELMSLNKRMPWLSGTLSLLQWLSLHGPGQLCDTNSKLDRLIAFNIHQRLLDANWLPAVLQAARSAVFPNNGLAPARIPPSHDEIARILRECANAIVDAIPAAVRARLFGTTDEDLMKEEVVAELTLLSDTHINKRLLVDLVELMVARLFPELVAVA